jgi:ABC-type nitrate/sulfonate/bicarbonate transport system substrate-binding protein
MLLILLAALFLTISNGVHAQPQAPLVVNYAAINANMLNLWIGKEANYFTEEGLRIESSKM